MSFTKERREQIKQYILEKIEVNDPDIVKKTAEVFQISLPSIYRYLNSLVSDNIIKKIGKKYQLNEEQQVMMIRYKDLVDVGEDLVFERIVSPLVNDLPRNVFEIWRYAFTEMMNNVIDHSESSKVVLSISRNILNTRLLISDNGVGIFQKIQKYYSFPSMDDAIAELFKGKLTTDTAGHSGEGIFFTSRALDRFAAISDGKVFSHDKYIESISDIPKSTNITIYPTGTTIYMELSNRSHKVLEQIFNEFADADGGFTKTRIPLKNIYETYPVSRSQAKRLVYRFEKFEEIILDFDEIPSLGQGFAHEIFVVFKKAHPNTKLTPINENENVMKMINHVMKS